MATNTGPLHGSPLAEELRKLVGETSYQGTDFYGLTHGLMRTPLGTQTLRAMEVYREAGEPEVIECPTAWADRVATWTRGALQVQVYDYGEYPEGVQVEWPHEDVRLSALSADDLRWCAAVKEAAHALAAEWRAEREKKEAATDDLV